MTDPVPPKAARSPVMVALGWLLAIFGGLWTALTGLCTGAFFVTGLSNGARASAAMVTVLYIATLVIAPGVLMLCGGIVILREQHKLGGS